MKGIILAGGTGSRLFPLTKVTNKHLLPVGNEPMIFHAVRKLVDAGIKEIMIVTGTHHMGDIVGSLGSGVDFDCEFTYRVQDEAGGIAQALSLAEGFIGHYVKNTYPSERFCVILGDNIFETELRGNTLTFEGLPSGTAMVLVAKVSRPERFGVAEVLGERILSIQEKPREPRSDLAVTGIYFYDAMVFDVIKTLRPSKRGELEITDVNNVYLSAGTLHWRALEGWWTDAGTFESLAEANRRVGGGKSLNRLAAQGRE